MEHALQNGPLSLTACTRYMVAAATQKMSTFSPGRRTAACRQSQTGENDGDDDDARSWRPIVAARHEQKPQSLASLDKGRNLGRLAS
jgi:hypothetical protein